MFDLEEINLMPTNIPDRPQTKGQDAHARAKAIECGAKWKCSRVKAWVDLDDCVARHAKARDGRGGDYQPCLECSSIVPHLRNMGKGLPGPMSMQSPPASAPKFEPKPLPQPKKETTMSRPAKKGTPDPIQQEAKTEPKLEIVSKPAPEVKEKAGTLTNPFAGWDAYDKTGVLRGKLDMFVSFTKDGLMTVSVGAQEAFGIMGYKSVDVYHRNEKLGLALHKDTSGVLAVVARAKSKSSATISARGLIKKFKLDGKLGKRFAVREIAPGFVEIDLKSEVAA